MKVALALLAFSPMLLAAPADRDLVVVTGRSKRGAEDKTVRYELGSPKITQMHITSNITNRFAHTLVRSKVKNEGDKAQETVFFVVIPERAYISSFVMEIGGRNYTAHVEEKEAAKKTYVQAVSEGFGAAHVAVSARNSNKFAVNLNIEPQTKAVFYLTYEEFLQRKEGRYEQVINIHPKQLVKDLRADVEINEARPLTLVTTPSMRSGNKISKESEELSPNALIFRPSDNSAVLSFNPDVAKQKQLARGLGKEEEEGIGGQFVVQYDVERDPHGGEVLVKDGYFVHFFAPSDLQPLNKHVVFVLDTSGSMYWDKMEQLKTAMRRVLDELRPKDYFNLVEFNSRVKVWNLDAPEESAIFPINANSIYEREKVNDLDDVVFPPAYPANGDNVAKAKKAVDNMVARGVTNIYEALRVAIKLSKVHKEAQPLIFFLTDGEPSAGKTDPNDIVSSISEQNKDGVPIIALSFGAGADRKFLENLSARNKGFARHIYEDSDASLQLENFYRDISSPLLSDVKFTYSEDVTGLSKVDFPLLFEGSELVVTGRLPQVDFATMPVVNCKLPTKILQLKPTVGKAVGQLERLWAYMTVGKYLEGGEMDRDKALDLALKYSFVTPVTSLVVVKPNGTSAVDAEPEEDTETLTSKSSMNKIGPGIPVADRSFGGGTVSTRTGGFGVMKSRIRPAARTTMRPAASTTTSTPPTLPPNFAPALAWLREHLRSDGSISFFKGSYLLGSNQTSPEDQPCTTPSSDEGRCKLLKDCQQLHPFLIDVKSFKRNFCAINGSDKFAGVCCPLKN